MPPRIFQRLLCLALFIPLSSFGRQEITLPTGPALSSDGSILLFSWAGDLWKASSQGGEATRLTHHPGHDHRPLLSADDQTLYFNSNRTGSTQIYRMPILGGVPEQLTFHTEGCWLDDLHPNNQTVLYTASRDHGGRNRSRLYEKSVHPPSAERLVFDSPARRGRYSPDGLHILFHTAGSRTFRKGYRGSQAWRTWLYSTTSETFLEPVHNNTGIRFPTWSSQGDSFFYITSQSGSYNLWEHRLGQTENRRVTYHSDDSTLFPAISKDGSTLVYRHLFDLYLIGTAPGSEPSKIKLHHRTTLPRPTLEALKISSTEDAAVTPGAYEWAFAAGHEIWAMDTVLKEPNRLTRSLAHESDLHFGHKGQFLYYLKDNGIDANYWRMSKSDPKTFWWRTQSFNHQQITQGKEPKSQLRLSPDHSQIAFIEHPGTIWIAKSDGTEARKLVTLPTRPYYQWSPDGKHLAYSVYDQNFNSEIYLISTDGQSDPINISRHPDNEFNPAWSPDGKILAFSGYRHSDSNDLFFVHLNRDSHFRTTRDGRLLQAEKAMKKDPRFKEDQKDKKDGKKGEPKKEDPVNHQIDFENIHKRIQHIALDQFQPTSLLWSPDSKHLYFKSKGSTYKIEPKTGAKPTLFRKGIDTIVDFQETDKLRILSGGTPATLIKGKLKKLNFNLPVSRDREHYQRIGFRKAWRTMRDTFYDPALNGRDWDQIRQKYELTAARAPTSRIFSQVLNLLLGELNASHLGFSADPFPKEWKFNETWRNQTAHLGIRLNPSNKITYIHPDGPADRPASKLEIGDRILRIDGQELDSTTPLPTLTNGLLERDILLTVLDSEDEIREITLRPISFSSARKLASEAILDDRRAFVEKQTNGKMGYLHISGMVWSEFEKFEHHLYERGAGKEGLIIDVRDNGGGFIADHLLTVLTQPRHAFTIPRDGSPGYPQDRSIYATWQKPLVVLCNQDSFSNAEIFAHAIKTLDRGKLVGVPTAGGVISTGSTKILDLGRLRMPFRGWFLLDSGQDMELHGAVPHVIVPLTPQDHLAQKDPQLEKAIEVLHQEIQEKGRKLPQAIYRSAE